jgi:hypothetical protein
MQSVENSPSIEVKLGTVPAFCVVFIYNPNASTTRFPEKRDIPTYSCRATSSQTRKYKTGTTLL